MTETLHIRLFGMFEAHLGSQALSGLHLREGERLLAFLVLHHAVPHTYRTLAQLFWPAEAQQNDDYEGGSYPRTRQAIYSLRRALGEQAWRVSSPGKSVVCFDLTDADVDLMEFDRLVQREDPVAWKQALDLHHTPLLNSWPEAWIKEARLRCLRSCARIQARLPADISGTQTGTQKSEQQKSEQQKSEALPQKQVALPEQDADAAPIVEECARLEAVGGAVPLDSALYVERQADREFRQALARQDSIVLVKGARQIGKTSLLARGLQQAREVNGRLLITDFQSISEGDLTSSEALFRALAQEMADQLDLDVLPEEVWNARRSASRNLERYLSDVVLKSPTQTLVWGMDEVDRLFSYPCANEVFGLFRSWHNRRALDASGPWSRLTLAIAYATEVHLFITDQNQSPFNVGTRLSLSDFTREQVADLNCRHGSPLGTEAALDQFYGLVEGHPYLVRCGLAAMAAHRVTVADLESQALQEEGPYGEHLLRLRLMLQKSPDLTETMRAILHNQTGNSSGRQSSGITEGVYRLRSAGLVISDAKGEVRPRCRLYALYLTQYLP